MRLLRVLFRKARTTFALPYQRKLGIAKAWWVLTWVHGSLYALPYRFWRKRLNTALNSTQGQALDPAAELVCNNLAQDVAVAARNHFLDINCLGKSLTLHTLCHRAGCTTRLTIGIRKSRGALQGHAWLEADGSILNDTQATTESFTALDRVPPVQPTFCR